MCVCVPWGPARPEGGAARGGAGGSHPWVLADPLPGGVTVSPGAGDTFQAAGPGEPALVCHLKGV